MEIKEYELKSLQPGFLVLWMKYPRPVTMKNWNEMQKQGWSGGLILRPGEEIDSLDEKLMADLGWQRIKGRDER